MTQRFSQTFLERLLTHHLAVHAAALLNRIYKAAIRVQPAYHPIPGFRGGLPYLAIIRIIASLGITLRFAAYPTLTQPPVIFLYSIPVYVLFSIIMLAISLRSPNSLVGRLIIAASCVDVIMITASFIATSDPRSDLYVFYLIAILTSYEHFPPARLAFTTIAVLTLLFLTYALLSYGLLLIDPIEAFLRIAAPRALLIVLVFLILYGTRQEALRRTAALRALENFRKTRPDSFSFERLTRRAMSAVVSTIRPPYIHLSLFRPSKQDFICVYIEAEFATIKKQISSIDYALYQSRVGDLNSFRLTSEEISCLSSPHFKPHISYLYIPLQRHSLFLGYLCVGQFLPTPYDDQGEIYLKSLIYEFIDELTRYRFVSALSRMRRSLARASDASVKTKDLVQTLVHKIGFEFAAISFVDCYLGKISMQQAENVPEGWLEKADHDLQGEDIQAYIIQNRKVEIIEGPDSRFDQKIYHRYQHYRLKRVFAPIYDQTGKVIGTLEAGCDRTQKAHLFSSDSIRSLSSLLTEAGPHINAWRKDQFLREISDQIIRVIGAGSVSIYLFEHGRPKAAAGAGRANPDFIRLTLPRSPYSNGVTQPKEPDEKESVIVIDNPEQLRLENELVYKAGVRTLCIVPLGINDHRKAFLGEIHVHYWDVLHQVSYSEVQLLEAIAEEASLAIEQYVNLQHNTKEAGRVGTIARLLNNIHLYATLPLDTALLRAVSEIAYMLSATNATLYLLQPGYTKFHMPPTRVGTFLYPDAMEGEVLDDDTPWNVLLSMDTDIRYVPNAQTDPVLTQPRRNEVNRADRFVRRENIRSCIIFRLSGAGDCPKSAGLLFLNFTERRDFDRVDSRMAQALRFSLVAFLEVYQMRRALVQSLQRREREINAMRKIDQLLVEMPKLHEFLGHVVEEAKIITGASRGCLFWLGETSLRLEHISGDRVEECGGLEKMHSSTVSKAYNERRSILVPDAYQFIEAGLPLSLPHYEAACSEIAVPLIENETVRGVLKIEADDVASFTREDVLVLETLAILVLLARHRINESEVHQRAQRLIDWKKTTDQIAHTLKTQKHIVMGATGELEKYVQLLKTGGVIDVDDFLELLSDIRAGMTSLGEKINNLRIFSTDEELCCEQCRPLDLIREAVGRLPLERLSVEQQVLEGWVVVDKRQIVEALQEILVNAVQAVSEREGDDSGRVLICSKTVEETDGELQWRLTVEDNGPGVLPELARRIFDPFVSLKPDGTGLGLAIARRRIEKNGGRICVGRSEELGGASFEISFTLAGCPQGTLKEDEQ